MAPPRGCQARAESVLGASAKGVGDGTVGAEEAQVSGRPPPPDTGLRIPDSRIACHRPPGEVLEPRMAESRFRGLRTGHAVPKPHGPILAAAREDRPVRFPVSAFRYHDRREGDGIGAVRMTRQLVQLRAARAIEQGDRPGGGRRGEQAAVGRPGEVDHIVVKLRGPGFREVHRDCQRLRPLGRPEG